MLPKKELNIYDKSEQNLQSLISFYFDKYDTINDDGVKILKEKTSISLNQWEFILRKISEAYIPIFEKHLGKNIKISNLIKYGIDVLVETKINGSQNRIMIAKEFEEYVRKTEIDIKYLEKNN